ncbi:UDP-N-acetylmuramate dehydrogenase [Patescibacteria group bacterium]|nr:UDP-N-acetylmuramate dehydrogenase [Patescibacteria group bacterium]
MNKIQKNVLLSPYTTFGIGGTAKYFAEARSVEEVKEFCDWAKKNDSQVFVLGGGSNVLISDKGFEGLVIKLKEPEDFDKFHFYAGPRNTKFVKVWAGSFLSKLIAETVAVGLTGLEWAVGIPGTIGGAVCGNAGAFGLETANSVQTVEALDCDNLTIKQFNNSGCDFCYRSSVFKYSDNLIILSAVFSFKKEDKKDIQKRLIDYAKQRTQSFGAGQKCAGCFFKNVNWKRKDINKNKLLENFPELKQFSDKPKISTGFLIDFVGLKGKKIGDAAVSDEHANFILNTGNAKAEEIMMLSGLIKDKIYSRYGFLLEEEVKLVGF